ncbi:MAG: molybdenum ABC transporter ATP-binding protein [Pedobacter sp.]
MKLEVSLEKQLGRFNFATEFSVAHRRMGVFGPSGSGKSTLMHMLAGLLKPDRGFIRLDEEILYDSALKIHRTSEKRRIGVVFQHANLFPHMGVRRNLFYGYKRIPKAERKIDPEVLLKVLNLSPLLDRGVGRLSGGERQRVALGRAVLSCPRLILLDEPLNGLDEELKYQIIPYLEKVLAEFDIPLMFISHSLNEMQLMTDQVLELAEGKLCALTSTNDLALRRLGTSQSGYMNLLKLHDPYPQAGLFVYRWGDHKLMLKTEGEQESGMFQLSSREITLFKRHPEATSARNLLHCRVKNLFDVGNRVGVELDCNGHMLVSQVVGEAVRDLDLHPGCEIFAVIKASAFRRLY